MKSILDNNHTTNRLALIGLIMICAGAGTDSLGATESGHGVALEQSAVVRRFDISPRAMIDSTGGVEAYVAEALARNPGIAAAVAEVTAAEARRPQATGLPDPRLSVTEFLEPVQTRVGPQQRALSLSQSFPWFGTLALKGEIETRKADVRRATLDDVILQVMSQVRAAYFEIAYLEEAIGITGRHIDLLVDWEAVARARYETGAGSYADVVKSQVELGVLGNRLAALEDRRNPLRANLNTLLDRSPDRTVTARLPASLVETVLDHNTLADQLLKTNPRLLAWDHREEAFAGAERLAGKSGYPSFTLGLNYIQTGPARQSGVEGSGTDAMSATLAVTLPLWRGKYDAGAREATGYKVAASATRSDLGNTLIAELAGSVFAFDDAGRKVALYGTTLLPKARQSLDAVRAAHETGQVGFLDLIDAERMLLEFELARVRAIADALIHEAKIERLTATPLQAGLK